jgi:hypothetical protein
MQQSLKRFLRRVTPPTIHEAMRRVYRKSSDMGATRRARQAMMETNEAAAKFADGGFLFDATPTVYNGINRPSNFGLPELGEKFRPTKRMHNYLIRYDHVFGAARLKVKRMVEIGVQSNASVEMWRDYFPNAEIIGIDIDPECKRFERDRIKIVIGDQTDRAFLETFARENFGTIDIIVDDGLHTPNAILTSFSSLYPALSTHGIYAIEDLIEHDYVPRLVADITAAINYWPDHAGKFWPVLDDLGPESTWFARHTTGVEFYRFILFVKRGLNPRDNPYILDKASYLAGYNSNIAKIADVEQRLIAQGKPVNEETLIDVVGFQDRHYVHDYLAGIRRYEFDEETKRIRSVNSQAAQASARPD